MIWQDIVIAIACIGFSIALIPSIRGKQKPARVTCLMTTLFMIGIAVSHASIGLWFAAISEAVTIMLWCVLLFQKRYNFKSNCLALVPQDKTRAYCPRSGQEATAVNEK